MISKDVISDDVAENDEKDGDDIEEVVMSLMANPIAFVVNFW